MNLDQITAIRIAIRDTTGAIARQETPEHTRTALQAHLDALLKEELRALTGQAPEGDLTSVAIAVDTSDLHAELARIQGAIAELRVSKYNKPTPWYPDDSGDWVEGHPRELPPDTPVSGYLYAVERENREYTTPATTLARHLSEKGIVAYKVVKP